MLVSVCLGDSVGFGVCGLLGLGRLKGVRGLGQLDGRGLGGLACGLGYTSVLVAIAVVREIMGFGTLLGHVLPFRDLWWHQWTIMVMPPGAFFMLAIFTWIARSRLVKEEKK